MSVFSVCVYFSLIVCYRSQRHTDVFFCWLYTDNRYQQVNASKLRRKVLNGPDFQLNRIRVASDSMMTEFNPNYEFGGGTYTIRDLKDIPREQLRLVK